MEKEEEFFDPPVFLGADLFGADSDDENAENQFKQQYFTREVKLQDLSIKIREFAFHEYNANYVWPGNLRMVAFINEHWDMFNNKKLLEIGSGTGVLAIYFKLKGFEIITSDYNDPEIEENIKFNCSLNGIDPSSVTHIRHSWGNEFPKEYLNSFDLVVANDIFLYDKEYSNLITTFEQLLQKPSVTCIIHWNRRIEEFSKFFALAKERNLSMVNFAPGIYVLKKEI